MKKLTPIEIAQNSETDMGAALASGNCSAALPIPQALYGCNVCCAEVSWPAEDLFWSEKKKTWICRECWDEEYHGSRGTSLAAEIQRQNADYAAGRNIG